MFENNMPPNLDITNLNKPKILITQLLTIEKVGDDKSVFPEDSMFHAVYKLVANCRLWYLARSWNQSLKAPPTVHS